MFLERIERTAGGLVQAIIMYFAESHYYELIMRYRCMIYTVDTTGDLEGFVVRAPRTLF